MSVIKVEEGMAKTYKDCVSKMTYHLSVTVYDEVTSAHYHSDIVTVPRAVWEELDVNHTDHTKPIFVEVGTGDGFSPFIGRAVPAVPADALGPEQCRVPEWMWIGLGAPLCDEAWIQLKSRELSMVGAITLRPRSAASLEALPDPVAALSAQIAATWVSVTHGTELVLPCGIFDVMGLTDAEGHPLEAGCILDTDVRLELEPALDAVIAPSPETHTPKNTPLFGPIVATDADLRFMGTGYRLGTK